MAKTNKRLTIVLTAAAAIIVLAATTVLAAGDTDDSISPPNASFTASGSPTFSATINGIPITLTCKTVSASGTTSSSGLGPIILNDPTFSGCTDNRGGTTTLSVNHNNGPWTGTFLDTANEAENPDSTEPNSGDGIQVGIPKAGATFTSSGCTVTLAPNGPASITGTYDDMGTLKFTNQAIPIAGSGCITISPTLVMNGTFVISPALHDVS